jgi:glycosyltransferase involved in cell wall biosynthesis
VSRVTDPKRICIVSSSSLSSGPRVEKEAQALSEAGYAVHAIVCHSLPWMTDWDARLASSAGIDYEAIPLHRRSLLARAKRGTAAMVHRTAGLLSDVVGTPRVLAELASSDRLGALLARGLRRRADLYIGHNLAALPVAAILAKLNRAQLAFDAEDDHVGELPDDSPPRMRRPIEAVQARYLPQCAYVSAPSEGISRVLAASYGIPPPLVVHNVFPWALRASLDGQRRDRLGAPISLHWYSQTVGLDRGLQDAIRAAGALRGNFELHIRGHADSAVRAVLLDLARAVGIAERMHFHPQVHPGELLSRCAEHDVGLALEQPVRRNKLETASNKIFFYLLAGVAVAASDTPGQTGVMRALPDAGFSYPPGDHAALALGLQRWIDDPAALQRAKAAALEAARTRWCWEVEREAWLARVRQVLSPA